MADQPVGLGQRIIQARERLGLTQRELADRAHIAVPVLNRLETGQRHDPGLNLLRRVARALRVSLDYLGERDWEIDPSERILAEWQACRGRTILRAGLTP